MAKRFRCSRVGGASSSSGNPGPRHQRGPCFDHGYHSHGRPRKHGGGGRQVKDRWYNNTRRTKASLHEFLTRQQQRQATTRSCHQNHSRNVDQMLPPSMATVGVPQQQTTPPLLEIEKGKAMAKKAGIVRLLRFSLIVQFAPDAYYFSELSAEEAALSRQFRRQHVHGKSMADRARDARRFSNAAQALERALAALGQPIRHGRNEPECFTCTDPSGHVAWVKVPDPDPEPGDHDHEARCCPLCLETLFEDDDYANDGDGGEDGGDVFYDQ